MDLLRGRTAILSPYSIRNSRRGFAQGVAAHAKRAALLCDHLFFDPQGLGPPGLFGDGPATDHAAAWSWIAGPDEQEAVEDLDFRRMIVVPSDLGDEESIMRALWETRDHGSEITIACEYLEGLDAGGRVRFGLPQAPTEPSVLGSLAIEIAADIWQPRVLEGWVENAVGLVTPLHSEAFGLGRVGTHDSFDVLRSVESSGAVDLGALSWPRVMALRRSRYLTDFRARLDELASAGGEGVTALWSELWDMLGDSEPRLARTFFGAVLGNFPSPIGVNPVGVAQAAHDLRDQAKRARRSGWLYFMMEAAIPE